MGPCSSGWCFKFSNIISSTCILGAFQMFAFVLSPGINESEHKPCKSSFSVHQRLWVSWMQDSLVFKGRCCGGFSPRGRSYKMRGLMWSKTLFLFREELWVCEFPPHCGSPYQGWGLFGSCWGLGFQLLQLPWCRPFCGRQHEGADSLLCRCFSGRVIPCVAIDVMCSWEEEVQDILMSACWTASKMNFSYRFFFLKTF